MIAVLIASTAIAGFSVGAYVAFTVVAYRLEAINRAVESLRRLP